VIDLDSEYADGRENLSKAGTSNLKYTLAMFSASLEKGIKEDWLGWGPGQG
jgi:hypothetical protein